METMTNSHTDNEINKVLILVRVTSRLSDSIGTDRENCHQLYEHENTDHLDIPSTRDNLGNKGTLDVPLADAQITKVTIHRGIDVEHKSCYDATKFVLQQKTT